MGIDVTIDGEKMLVTINRLQVRNALDQEAYRAVAAAWRLARENSRIKVVIVTGAGESFCAGADLKSFVPEIDGATGFPMQSLQEDADEAMLRVQYFCKPIIAAVNGVCVAGGMELMLATDIRIASTSASFGLPEVCRGLIAGGGSTVRLPRQVSYPHAMDILLTGRRISAEEACQMGLINRVVAPDQLMDEAIGVADQIIANSPNSVRLTKQSVIHGLRTDEQSALAFERQIASEVLAHPDAVEGLAAFAQKRTPQWTE